MTRPQTVGVFAAVALVIAALVAAFAATTVTTRLAAQLREERDEEIAPLERSVAALQVDLLRLTVQARVYGLSGDASARDVYSGSALQLQSDLARFTDLARVRGVEAAPLTDAVNAAAARSSAVVNMRDAGDVPGAIGLLATDDPELMQAVSDEAEVVEQGIAADVRTITRDIEDAEDRELMVAVLAVAIGVIAAMFLVWLALRNRSLTRRLATDRKRVDDLIASVPGVVWEAWGRPDAASQRIDFVSDYIEEMLGYSTDEWLTTPNFWLSVVHPHDASRAAAEAAAIFESRKRGESQFRWIARDGRVLHVLAYSAVITDAAGNPAGMRGITFDISERVRAEHQLRFTAQAGAVLLSSLDADETLQAVAQLAVPEVADWCAVHVLRESGEVEQVAVAHRDPEKVAWARELQERYPSEPRADRGIHHVISSGEAELVPSIPEEMLREAARDDEHLRLLREVGLRSYICVPMIARGRTLGAFSLISSESGRSYDESDLALARDLAGRAAIAIDNARLHGTAERERARFASMVESSPLAVCQLDAEGRIEHTNPAAERLLGRNGAMLNGAELHAIVHQQHEGDDEDACPLLEMGKAGRRRRLNVVTQFTRSDGARFDAELNSAPIVLGDGSVAGAVIAFQDVTERMRQDQMKDDFIGFASHELRSPLTTINGMAKWLARDVAQHAERFNDDEREAVDAMTQGADRMRGIVELFLDLTRIEAGRLDIEPQESDFRRLLREEAEAASVRHPAVEIDVTIPAEAVTGWCDEHRLRQVLVNLLDNAVRYGGDPPRVRATLEASGGQAVLRVRDNGSGIPEADRPRIFERFYRGAGVQGKGLGIGLFVSKQIVERLGGTLTFVSGDRGTEFIVSVPLSTDGSAPPAGGPSRREPTAATTT
jgi:PAS domain S-box-containing protein